MLTFEEMRPQERKACSRLAARAFLDYEYFSLYLPDRQKRETCLKNMLASNFSVYRKKAVFLTAKQDRQLAAVAQLSRIRSQPPTALQYLKAGFWKVLLQGGYENMAAWYAMEQKAEEPCFSLPGDTWFLHVLTVEPSIEGKGIGSRMLQECIIPCVKSQGGITLCLFTNSEINRKFYLKNGFEEFHAQVFSHQGKSVGSWSYRMSLS